LKLLNGTDPTKHKQMEIPVVGIGNSHDQPLDNMNTALGTAKFVKKDEIFTADNGKLTFNLTRVDAILSGKTCIVLHQRT